MIFKKRISPKRFSQIKKIVRYGRDILGLKISFIDKSLLGEDSGHYHPPSQENGINIPAQIKIDNSYNGLTLIFILLHEIGHHIDFLERGVIKEEDEAYEYYPTNASQAPCPEKYASLIRHTEEMACEHAQKLAVYLGLKLPEYSLVKDYLISKLYLDEILLRGTLAKGNRRKLRSRARKLAKQTVKKV